MKLILITLFLTVFLIGYSAAQCPVSSAWANTGSGFSDTRVVNCSKWISIFEGTTAASTLTVGASTARVDVIDAFLANIAFASIGTRAISDFSFEAFQCDISASNGDNVTCSLSSSDGDLTLDTAFYLPTGGDLQHGVPDSFALEVTLSIKSQSDTLPLTLSFVPVTVTAESGAGCSTKTAGYYCGYTCNPELISFNFASRYSGSGSGSVSINNVAGAQVVTFNGSAGKDVAWHFAVTTYTPTADDCNNPPSHGGDGGGNGSGSSPASFVQISFFMMVVSFLLSFF